MTKYGRNMWFLGDYGRNMWFLGDSEIQIIGGLKNMSSFLWCFWPILKSGFFKQFLTILFKRA